AADRSPPAPAPRRRAPPPAPAPAPPRRAASPAASLPLEVQLHGGLDRDVHQAAIAIDPAVGRQPPLRRLVGLQPLGAIGEGPRLHRAHLRRDAGAAPRSLDLLLA